MANGDAAAAAGLPVVPATKDIRQGYDDINKLADVVAGHVTTLIATAKIADKAVTTAKLADKAVTAAKLADKGIGTAQIADYAVGFYQIAPHSVGQFQTVIPSTYSEFGEAAPGWVLGSQTGRYEGYVTDVILRLRRTGGTITPDAHGGIADSIAFQVLDLSYAPPAELITMGRYAAASGATWPCMVAFQTDGDVVVQAITAGEPLTNGAAGVTSLAVDFHFIKP